MAQSHQQRSNVEVWFRRTPPRPLCNWLHDLEPDDYQVTSTDIPAREVGGSVAELARLVVTLQKRSFKTEDGHRTLCSGDLVVVPGSNHLLRLVKYPATPVGFGHAVLAFGGNRYAIQLGLFLRNGTDHPCYRPAPGAGSGASGVRQPGVDLSKSPGLPES